MQLFFQDTCFFLSSWSSSIEPDSGKYLVTKQNSVGSAKEFSYYTVNKIFGSFNQRICFVKPKVVFFCYNLAKFKKYFIRLNRILFDLTKDLCLLDKMIWLDQVNFFSRSR